MEKSRREQLLELCGGRDITPHQRAQVSNLKTRHVAISDLGKVIRLYLTTKAWQDEKYETELCLLALRGPELLTAIEKEIFGAVKLFIDDPQTNLDQVLESLLTIHRRPVQDEDDKYGQEDCATVVSIQYIYWSMAIGLRSWPELDELVKLESSLQGRLALRTTVRSRAKAVQGLLDEVISTKAQVFVGKTMAQQFPGASFIFSPDNKPHPEKLSPKTTTEELLKKERRARNNLSKYFQACELIDVVNGWLALGDAERALEAAHSIRRHDKQCDALAHILDAGHQASGDWGSNLLDQLEEAINGIPFQTKCARFGGTGRERARHLTRLAVYRKDAGDKAGSAACMFRALSELTTPSESVYDQVDFALLAAPMAPESGVYLSYAIHKIGTVWNWGDQIRMFKWLFECCCQLEDASLLETTCGEIEPHLAQLESATPSPVESVDSPLPFEPRTGLYINLYLARALIHHGQTEKALKLLCRIEALSRWVQQDYRCQYRQLLSQAFTESGEFEKALAVASKIKKPLNRCRSSIFLLGEILKNGGGNLINDLEGDLDRQTPSLKRKSLAEIKLQRKILENSLVSGEELASALDDIAINPEYAIHGIWSLFKAEAFQLKAWVKREGKGLSPKLAELEEQLQRPKNSYLRKACEVLLALSDWDGVCRLIDRMPRDCQETVQLMNHPLMVNALFEKYPRYEDLSQWMNSMGVGELTHRWIMRQWRRQTALTASGARDLLRASFADSDWWANQWAVRCYLLATLREAGWREYQRIEDNLSNKMKFPINKNKNPG